MPGRGAFPRLIGWSKLEEIVEVDADINNRGTVAAKRFGQLCRIGNDLCGWMRRGTHADDGILEVNENKCCFVGIKLKFCHGTPLGKDLLSKSRAPSISKV